MKIETRPNGRVHIDLLYIKLLVEHIDEPDDEMIPEVIVMHMLDEATRWRLGVELQNKSESALKGGLTFWVSIFGFPEIIECDEESRLMSEGFKVWLEENNSMLHPNPAVVPTR